MTLKIRTLILNTTSFILAKNPSLPAQRLGENLRHGRGKEGKERGKERGKSPGSNLARKALSYPRRNARATDTFYDVQQAGSSSSKSMSFVFDLFLSSFSFFLLLFFLYFLAFLLLMFFPSYFVHFPSFFLFSFSAIYFSSFVFFWFFGRARRSVIVHKHICILKCCRLSLLSSIFKAR